ncbi:MAG: mechanosensitive ion channel family protein [bacterium]|uniref:Mechanosensitive ion channel family protein n=1 Tax=Candidatus Methylomirabilis tolerans TaxID=3123416 RepID=A0AAJ1ETU8_9BACT|nr:mechanosensitive ion channel family protein [Candidatus Methylomirabilis sp.]
MIVELLIAVAVGLLASAWLLWLRRIGLRALTRLAHTTEGKLDDLALSAFRLPSLLWCLVLGVYIGLIVAPAMPTRIGQLINDALVIVLILSVTIAVGRFLAASVVSYADRLGLAIAATGLATALVKGVVYLCGALVLLSTLGISITPILTALGVGGLAVALALQGSLTNLFAGIHILVEKPVRVGDYIKLESSQEGYVVDIGWQTTRIRMLPNNMVIVPNAKLAESIVVNYHLPEKRMSVLIPISVGYGSDPTQVEAILVEEATRAVGEVQGLLAEPAPFVRFIPGFGESSLDFTLIVQISEFVDQYLVQHELRKRIFARFQKEGIEIPFPQRVVHVHTAAIEVPPAVGTDTATTRDVHAE